MELEKSKAILGLEIFLGKIFMKRDLLLLLFLLAKITLIRRTLMKNGRILTTQNSKRTNRTYVGTQSKLSTMGTTSITNLLPSPRLMNKLLKLRNVSVIRVLSKKLRLLPARVSLITPSYFFSNSITKSRCTNRNKQEASPLCTSAQI